MPTEADLSPKVVALFQRLKSYKDLPAFCCIVFVQRRATARVLGHLLRKWEGLEFLRVGVLVGHGVGGSVNDPDAFMRVREQTETVRRFGSGELNLLVATQVAEEGLDIQPCKVVIRFDMFQNLAAYIQSRGRARHPYSQFVVMAASNYPVHAELLEGIKAEDQRMRATLAERAKMEGYQDDDENEGVGDDELAGILYVVESTGASVSMATAIRSVNHYCDLLPRDGFTNLGAEYVTSGNDEGTAFHTEIVMPRTVPRECRRVVGGVQSSKKKAKRAAAFEMVKVLHQAGELDERLRPVVLQFREVVERVVPEGSGGGVCEVRMHVPRAFAESWGDGVVACLTLLRGVGRDGRERVLDLAILSVSEVDVPQFTLDVGLSSVNTCTTVTWTKERIDLVSISKIRKFHYHLFTGLLRSKISPETKWNPLVVPIRPGMSASRSLAQMLDWTVIDGCQRDEIEPLTARKAFEDLVVVDRLRYERKYVLGDVVPGASPYTPLAMGKFANVAEFYGFRLHCKERILETQAVFHATTVPHIAQNDGEDFSKTTTYLIPQFCTVHPIPARLLAGDALLMPLILRRLHHLLTVHDFLLGQGVRLRAPLSTSFSASLENLSSALTAPKGAEPRNYERLEILGDAFLKVLQTVHLFVHHPERQEGWLSVARNRAENNGVLQEHAVQTGVAGFVLSEPLSRRTWVPPSTDDVTVMQEQGDKTLADVVEAVIGANVLDGGVRGGSMAARYLMDDSYQVDWSRYAAIWKEKRPKVGSEESRAAYLAQMEVTVNKVQGRLGYRFKEPLCLVEALTHPTAVIPLDAESYQRLEFLGDSALTFLIMRYIYNLPAMCTQGPGPLTTLRAEMVNNQFLACVACSLHLPRNLNHMSPYLARALTNFGTHLEDRVRESRDVVLMKLLQVDGQEDNILPAASSSDAGVNAADQKDPPSPLFWNDLPAAPKAAGDVYEAVIGAVLVDSGFDIEVAWDVVRRTLVEGWWRRFELELVRLSEEGARLDPVSEIMQMVDRLKCRNFTTEMISDKGGAHFDCRLLVHDRVIGTGKAGSKKEAKRIAATEAISIARADLNALTQMCTCDVESGEGNGAGA
ncbi:Dicer-like protein 1 [Rhizophlyctis rosea]|nr:Dicer-like protein 1 [Rhizophlyctis rosea]